MGAVPGEGCPEREGGLVGRESGEAGRKDGWAREGKVGVWSGEAEVRQVLWGPFQVSDAPRR